MKNNLSKVEVKLLVQLDRNARGSISFMAKRLRISQQLANYYFQQMLGSGKVQGFFPVIDYARLGMLNFRVYLKIVYVNKTQLKEIVDYFVKLDEVNYVASCGGRWDLLVGFFSRNPSQFNKTFNAALKQFSDRIKSYQILTTIYQSIHTRKHLLRKRTGAESQTVIIGGDREKGVYDLKDLGLLQELNRNPRASSVFLGRNLGLHPKTVVSRLKRLHKEEILFGVKSVVNMEKTGLTQRKLLLSFHNPDFEKEQSLFQFAKEHPNIIRMVRTLGSWDVELDCEMKDSSIFREIELNLREKFEAIIKDSEELDLYSVYKVHFLPLYSDIVKV